MLYLNAKQRAVIRSCLCLLAIAFVFPPYKQVNYYTDGTKGNEWVGYSTLWTTPPQPGRRGGSVYIYREVLVVEVVGILALLAILTVSMRGYPAGCCQRCGYDMRGSVSTSPAACPECGAL